MSYDGPLQETPVEVVRVGNGVKWGLFISVITLVLLLVGNAVLVGVSYGRLSANQGTMQGKLIDIEKNLDAIEVRDNQIDRRLTTVETSLENHRNNSERPE